ncbi:DEAD/DEAH box helicase family protein [Dactylosporangium salmoneum]|uniref:Helicase C-terminal domain-containing protein n=1 Tax=Dactylosporangium salmoneum TaxID=53361 RepID=A0ABN3FJW3_9ACTN
MINVATAARLLNFNGALINRKLADDQLDGAVALHNIMQRHGFAYLADEVGMGKTYVALGVVALLRHFRPDLRVLVVAPRENIQRKWQRERLVFTEKNVVFDDLRVRMPPGVPTRPAVHCNGLIDLLHETALDADRDFFVRLPSFRLPLKSDPQQRRTFRDRLRRHIPWLADDLVDLRAPAETVKDRFAQAINTVLPRFDLVIIDEAHNLKHGYGRHASSRNQVLATVLGRARDDIEGQLRPKYGPRAGKVLLISATPVDDDYSQLWHQLDVFGLGEPFRVLLDAAADEQRRRAAVGEFLIRRSTALSVHGRPMTKNLYRREWRQGGLREHDEPIRITDDRERLTVALVQKKVAELLGHERFGTRFQVGMLASFESFQQTSKVHLDPDDPAAEPVNFDGADQTDREDERSGVDVPMLDALARDHRDTFGTDLPHPKMDALVARLRTAWHNGRKGLVFVRRVASVGELQQRLNDEYNRWLFDRLEHRLAPRHRDVLDEARARFLADQRADATRAAPASADEDAGGTDTFFAWFFRGGGPDGLVSGATIQERFRNRGGPLGTFFDDNHVMAVLDAPRNGVRAALTEVLGASGEDLAVELRELSRRYLSESAKQPTRGARFDAMQAAALELLAHAEGPHRPLAAAIWNDLYRGQRGKPATGSADPELLETETFFTELRRRKALREALWPAPPAGNDPAQTFRDGYIRAQLLSAAARLGHSFIDLYCTITDHLPGLRGAAAIEPGAGIATAFLDELQRRLDDGGDSWSSLAELTAVADHHDLILDTNLPEIRQRPLVEASALATLLFRAQRPVGGMAGQVNRTLVQQFRLPGYPLVLICTDLLQEGEDLHTFCSDVYHYGLAWTPSAIEQRIGRIDRVRSATERRLTALTSPPTDDELLQVYYPHLVDTVERLQARRVLRRLNDFAQLMHEGLGRAVDADSHIDIAAEALADDRIPAPPAELLATAFPVRPEHLAGPDRPIDASQAQALLDRFDALARPRLGGLAVEWEPVQPRRGLLLGTAKLESGRQQPFSLQVGWESGHLLVHCVSPVGLIGRNGRWDELAASTETAPVRLGAFPVRAEATYDITVEEDVLLTAAAHDSARAGALIRRVTAQADALEAEHLPERDRRLAEFRSELEHDARHRR